MIHVIAGIQIAPGQRDKFLEEFHKLVPLVHAEAGCIEYGPTLDAPTDIAAQNCDENRVTIVEKWESLEALQAHLVADHMAAYRERVKNCVAGMQLQILAPA